MNNFTTLIPIERSGSLRQSLRHVTRILNEGYNALIFPEGTRSTTGEIAEFKPVIGYLALHQKTGILPIYLWGNFRCVSKRNDDPSAKEHRSKGRCKDRPIPYV
jgi:long-chain acyl-CoA synthetase